MTGDYPAAARTQEEALAIYACLGDRLLVPIGALNNLAAVRRLTGDYPGAARVLEEALGIARDLGDRLGQAHVLSNLGAVRRLTGDYRAPPRPSRRRSPSTAMSATASIKATP